MNPGLDLLRACVALIFVLGLMWSLGYLIRRYGHRLGLPTMPLTGPNRRLQVVEVLPIDARNKLILVRRDTTEHLILVGSTESEVIEKNLTSGKLNASETV